MNKERLELYTDYLLSTFGYATGLSAMVNGQVSHDQVARFLSGDENTPKDLWQAVNATVRKMEREDAVRRLNTDRRNVLCRSWGVLRLAG